MARLLATAIAVPPYRIDRETCRRLAAQVYPDAARQRAALGLLDGARIDSRYLSRPVEEVLTPHPLGERSARYRETMIRLCEAAARRALDRARLRPDDVDQIVTSSCTGFMIPSVDAYLVERLGLRREVARLPLTELGCAGGGAALRQAREHLLAHPGHVSLVVSCELPSLAFRVGDGSMANLVGALLFGDGAGAAVVGRRAAHPSPSLIDARTHLFRESQRLMGFDLEDDGFKLILDRELPSYLRGRVRPLVDAFLADHRLTLADIRFCALHPGGRRILEGLDAELGIGGLTRASWEVLRHYGNLSSATVLFVLDALLSGPAPEPGSFGLLAAFGPGFSCELGLLRWDD